MPSSAGIWSKNTFVCGLIFPLCPQVTFASHKGHFPNSKIRVILAAIGNQLSLFIDTSTDHLSWTLRSHGVIKKVKSQTWLNAALCCRCFSGPTVYQTWILLRKWSSCILAVFKFGDFALYPVLRFMLFHFLSQEHKGYWWTVTEDVGCWWAVREGHGELICCITKSHGLLPLAVAWEALGTCSC